MKQITLLFSIIFASMMMAPGTGLMAGSIKKCKDAKGRWHYGSSAAKACARSEVIEFNAGKTGARVHEAPPTQQELDAARSKKKSEEQKKERLAEQDAQDKILAASYAHEDDIIYERNRKLKDLQASIDSGASTLASLTAVRDRVKKRADEEMADSKKISKQTAKTLASAERQVKRHERVIQEKTRELEEMKIYYDKALKRYREMKQRRGIKAK